jgi:glycosyltransferase involved in cell wall biosynthesis
MKILVVHDRYQRVGGEDIMFDAETAVLERYGEQVLRYTVSNDEIDSYSRASLVARTVWNPTTFRRVQELIRATQPDVMHVHNTLPLISPSIYSAAHAERLPVVQTLHNFRLLCPNGLLMRSGNICEECIGTVTRWPGVVHRCYRESRGATAAIATMLGTHTLLGTWRHRIDRYIAPAHFLKHKFISAGWPAEKIVVKPNFLACDPGMRTAHGDYALFVGRLSSEKGVGTLLDAWRRIANPPLLKIAGDGPLMPADRGAQPGIEWLGHQPSARVFELMKAAAIMIVPSEWYEVWPLTIIEAFATGVPIIATRLGAMAEMISDGETGVLYTLRDVDDLARTIEWALGHPATMAAMARRARAEFECKYTPEPNYRRLIEIYREAINEHEVQRLGVGRGRRDYRDVPRVDGIAPGSGATSGQRAH